MSNLARRLPRGFRRDGNDQLACPHRDLSCCDECVQTHDAIVYCAGVHYWIADPLERAATRALSTHFEAGKRVIDV